jgi:murein DD-endopeptidase MepM/ murein hydrolase activator NlpD
MLLAGMPAMVGVLCNPLGVLLNYAAMPRNLLLVLIFLCAVANAQQLVTVKAGDTLWALSQQYGVSVEEILSTNGLTGTDLLPGAILRLPVSASTPETYTVENGDTLYDIAVAFNVPVDSLIAINNIDGSVIKPGQVLHLQAPVNNPPAPLVVTVTAGDSLWGIASSYDTTIEAVMQANSLSTDVLNPGAQLIIPGRYAATTSADQGGAAVQTVEVAKGDTLYDIAHRYNTSVMALISANNLNGTTIEVGQQLRIIPGNELLGASSELPPQPAASATMVWPLNGPITSNFGYRRLRIGGTNMHSGLDIDGETGDPIVSATAGIVTFSGWHGGLGNLVVVQDGNTEYYYAHCSELLVSEGQSVAVGQLVALVGLTGRSTGSHLHFEVRVDDTPVDPLSILEQYAAR